MCRCRAASWRIHGERGNGLADAKIIDVKRNGTALKCSVDGPFAFSQFAKEPLRRFCQNRLHVGNYRAFGPFGLYCSYEETTTGYAAGGTRVLRGCGRGAARGSRARGEGGRRIRHERRDASVAPDAEVAVKGPQASSCRAAATSCRARSTRSGKTSRGLRCMDIGSFDGRLLRLPCCRPAPAGVACVDVNYGQLAWSLRQDPRVAVFERTNIRLARSGEPWARRSTCWWPT